MLFQNFSAVYLQVYIVIDVLLEVSMKAYSVTEKINAIV